jgi:hypothetical protein
MLSFRIFLSYILGFDAPDFRYFSLKRPFFSGGILQHRFVPSFDYFRVILGYSLILDLLHLFLVIGFVFYSSVFIFQSRIDLYCIILSLGQELSNINCVSYSRRECNDAAASTHFDTFTHYYFNTRFHFFLYQHNKSYNSIQLYHSLDRPDPNSIYITTSLQHLTWTTRLTGRRGHSSAPRMMYTF